MVLLILFGDYFILVSFTIFWGNVQTSGFYIVGKDNLRNIVDYYFFSLRFPYKFRIVLHKLCQYCNGWCTGSLCRQGIINHYNDVIMSSMASKITGVSTVRTIFCSGTDQRKLQSSTSLAFVREFTGDRRIPLTKGQSRGKCFHLMTSSCFDTVWHWLVLDHYEEGF